MNKPRIGLVLLRAIWLQWDSMHRVNDALEEDLGRITTRLEPEFDIPVLWIIDSQTSMQKCLDELQPNNIDLVILIFQTMTDNQILVPLLNGLEGLPVALWCYTPWRRIPLSVTPDDLLRGSGASGALAALNLLHDYHIPFFFTYGAPEDRTLISDLRAAGHAARTRTKIRSSKVGLLPTPIHLTSKGKPTESSLVCDLVPQLHPLTIEKLRESISDVREDDIDHGLISLSNSIKVYGVNSELLRYVVQSSLGLAQLTAKLNLDCLAVDDSSHDLTSIMRFRPSLNPNLFNDETADYLPTNDPCSATAALTLSHLSSSPILFMNIWLWDEPRNHIIGGRSGLQNPQVALPGTIVLGPDIHPDISAGYYGAKLQFIARPGRVTLFQLRASPTGWLGVASTGICLDSQPLIEGYPHAVIRLDPIFDRFIKRLAEVGASPNWIMAYGSVIPELEIICKLSGIQLEVLV